MNREEALGRIHQSGVIAILRHTEASLAIETAEALLAGGVDVAEVTLNTAGALDMIRALADHFGPGLVLGAGTVLHAEAAEQAIAAGAQFIVSPHLDEEIVRFVGRAGKLAIPGAFTPTEVVQAWRVGAGAVKVFPAGAVGPRYIRDLLGPLPRVRLVPTGGVNLDNAAEFMKAGSYALGLGAALADPRMVQARDFGGVSDRARRVIEQIQIGRGG